MRNYALLCIFAVGLFNLLISMLRRVKGFQAIYDLSPESHKKKRNTVSFGGLGIVITVLVGVGVFKILNPYLVWVVLLFFSFSIIGFIDDFLSSVQKQNKGLSARQKFLVQCVVATVFLVGFHAFLRPLGLFELIFYEVMIVGASNATNLTDGLDGLLGGLSLVTLMGFFYYFQHIGFGVGGQFCGIVMVAMVAFLAFNRYPASIFMGDTGSLALGALFAGLAIISPNPWVLVTLGAVYIIETLSVIIQVFYYKQTKRRIFLMAPLHHHFELLGLSERKTVSLFWAMGLGFLLLFIAGLS